MWKVNKWIYLIFLIPFLAVGIGMIIYAYTGQGDLFVSSPFFDVRGFFYMMGAFFIILSIVIVVALMLFYGRINAREANLMSNGLQGQAKILQVQQTGMYVNELPQVKFLLEITSPDGVYQMEHKAIVNMLNLASIHVGAILPVYIDPNNKKNILLSYG